MKQSQHLVIERAVSRLWNDIRRPKTPIDAFHLAHLMRAVVLHSDELDEVRGARLLGYDPSRRKWTIEVNSHMRLERVHSKVAHELGHIGCRRARIKDTEEAANLFAAGLMLPKWSFETDFKRERWDLAWMKAKHIHCSWELLVRRAVTLFFAVGVIHDISPDDEVKVERLRHPDVKRFEEVSPLEQHMIDCVLAEGEHIEFGPGARAFAVFDEDTGWRRVVTILDVMRHKGQMWRGDVKKLYPIEQAARRTP